MVIDDRNRVGAGESRGLRRVDTVRSTKRVELSSVASEVGRLVANRNGARTSLGTTMLMGLIVATSCGAGPAQPDDDRTFRPTVVVRKGNGQGSGTVIASKLGKVYVLTAAHVVKGAGRLSVELHRYNFGLENAEGNGPWPRQAIAEIVALDHAADVAVLAFPEVNELPYIARLALQDESLPKGSVVTSVGIDQGKRFSGWTTQVVSYNALEMERNGEERTFLITARPPEHGRSGGGLFLQNGELVGVCIGYTEFIAGRRSGIFAPAASIRQLLQRTELNHIVNRAPTEVASSFPGRAIEANRGARIGGRERFYTVTGERSREVAVARNAVPDSAVTVAAGREAAAVAQPAILETSAQRDEVSRPAQPVKAAPVENADVPASPRIATNVLPALVPVPEEFETNDAPPEAFDSSVPSEEESAVPVETAAASIDDPPATTTYGAEVCRTVLPLILCWSLLVARWMMVSPGQSKGRGTR